MKAEEFYKKENYPKYDKYDKKANYFSYYDMLEFAERYYNHDRKEIKDKTFKKWVTKIIGFPFVVCLLFISYMYFFIKHIISFVIYGSELIVFTKEMNRNSIRYLVDKLNEKF